MSNTYRFIALCMGGFPLLATASANEHPSQDYLWYRQPAIVRPAPLPWTEGESDSGNLPGKDTSDAWESQTLPVGNGRIGGTIFGGNHRERINLNEVSLWSGGPNLPNNGYGYTYGPTAGKNEFGSYQPFGNLYIDFKLKGEATEYSRSLNLKDGIARVSFTDDGVKHERECFVSHPDNVLVYMAKTDTADGLNAKIALTPCHTVTYSKSKTGIIMSGKLANGEKFEGQLLIKVQGGTITAKGKSGTVQVNYRNKGDNMEPTFSAANMPYIEVKGAQALCVYVSLATDYKMEYEANWKGADPRATNSAILSKLNKKSYKAVRSAHTKNYKALYNRLRIKLGKTDSAIAALPTDERISAYRNGGQDPELEATIYQYGRYVLICGSRPGNLPVNLQGIWNDKVHAAWACDYHNNINLQMCYWGAEVGNLSECHMPFISFIKAMEKPLTQMTAKHFGSSVKGWTTRISQNPWGGGGWEKWNPPVNAWYALHVWEHYNYTRDKAYLKNIGYPILKNICAFWQTRLKKLGKGGEGLVSNGQKINVADYPELKEIKAGALVSPESWSHEWGPIEDGVMHDQQLIWELFDNTAKAAKELGTDEAWAEKLLSMRDKLVPCRVGKGGYLQEWIIDRDNLPNGGSALSGHRHTSHLIGVFPGTSISMAKTPELAKAAMKSLKLRGCGGDNRRSWTWPWRTALWARFGDTQQAYEMVQNYIRYNVLDNLFGNHPPMQMDGTYGMTGGMSEMLLQSHAGYIHLLPTLPAVWNDGYVKGIRARGNITVDMKWKDGQVIDYKLTTTSPPEEVTVIVNGEKKSVLPTLVQQAKDKAEPTEQKSPETKKKKKKLQP